MPDPIRMTVHEWKAALAKGETPDAIIFKVYAADEIKALQDRQVQVVVSTGAVDRDHDTIDPHGWDLKNFKKANGPVLFAHDYHSLPIAKTDKIWVEDEKLKALARFATAEEYAFADSVYKMVKGGFLNCASVGFRPMKHAYVESQGGFEISKAELLEYSFVPVPANQECLVEAKASGIDLAPITDWCERYLDNHYGGKGVWIPREQVEAVFKAMNTKTVVTVPAKASEPVVIPEIPVDPDPENATKTGGLILFEDDSVLTLADSPEPVEEKFSVDLEDLSAELEKMIQNELVSVVANTVRAEVNYARGRIE